MESRNNGLRLSPPWITPAFGLPDRKVQPVIFVQRRRLLLYPAYVQDYLDKVTAADVAAGNTSGLEMGVTDAASTFLQDLVSISYLAVSSNVISQAASVIKAMPIMAGARTRRGALVPVVGPVPTEFGAAGGWSYNRKTGIAGNGTDNYLDTGRFADSDPQNNQHQSVWVQQQATTAGYPIFIGGDLTHIIRYSTENQIGARNRNLTPDVIGNSAAVTGFIGISRASSTQYSARLSGTTSTYTRTSNAPSSGQKIIVFANGGTAGAVNSFTNARLSFYSCGESLNMALLDSRLTTLMAALSAAIP